MDNTAISAVSSTPSWANAADDEMSSQFPRLSDTLNQNSNSNSNSNYNPNINEPSTSNATANRQQENSAETNGMRPYPIRKGTASLPFGRKTLPGCKFPVPPIPYKVITNPDIDHTRTAYMILDPAGMPYLFEHVWAEFKKAGFSRNQVQAINQIHTNNIWEIRFQTTEARKIFSSFTDIEVQGREGQIYDPNFKKVEARLDWLSYDVDQKIILDEMKTYGRVENLRRETRLVDGEQWETNIWRFDLYLTEGTQPENIPSKIPIGSNTAFLLLKGFDSCLSCGARGHTRNQCRKAYCSECRHWVTDDECSCGRFTNFKKLPEYIAKQDEKERLRILKMETRRQNQNQERPQQTRTEKPKETPMMEENQAPEIQEPNKDKTEQRKRKPRTRRRKAVESKPDNDPIQSQESEGEDGENKLTIDETREESDNSEQSDLEHSDETIMEEDREQTDNSETEETEERTVPVPKKLRSDQKGD